MENKQERQNKITSEKENKEKQLQKILQKIESAEEKWFTKERLPKVQKEVNSLIKKINKSFEFDENQIANFRLRFLKYFQNNNDFNQEASFFDGLQEMHEDYEKGSKRVVKYFNTDKGSIDVVLRRHEERTLEKIAENRKKRAEITGDEYFNPYEALLPSKSGEYYISRLLNMPHLEEESNFMKHCVGTSNSYVNKIKRGDVEILSFRRTPEINKESGKLEKDEPIITIEYDIKKNIIKQIKKADDGYITLKDPYLEDFIYILKDLKKTKNDNGEERKISKINNSELSGIIIPDDFILTDRGVVYTDEFQKNDFILKIGKITSSISDEKFTEVMNKKNGTSFEVGEIARLSSEINENTRYFEGSLDESHIDILRNKINTPFELNGELLLYDITTIEDITFPCNVSGRVDLESLVKADNTTLPQSIGGDLYLNSMTSAEGIIFPINVGGSLELESLISVKDLTLPKNIDGDLELGKLVEVENLILPQSIGGFLALENLETVNNLTLPQSIGGNLWLSALETLEGCTLPQNAGGSFELGDLTTIEGLTFPESINGSLILESLISIDDFVFPQNITKDLDLNSLKNINRITLPKNIDGSLWLGSITTAKNITFPKNINGDLDLNSLKSIDELVLPEVINGKLELESLDNEEKEKLAQKYPQYREKIFDKE